MIYPKAFYTCGLYRVGGGGPEKKESETMNGTPKNLNQAVCNGLMAFEGFDVRNNVDLVPVVEAHVKDYLAQKFGAVILAGEPDEAAKLIELFKRITEGGDE